MQSPPLDSPISDLASTDRNLTGYDPDVDPLGEGLGPRRGQIETQAQESTTHEKATTATTNTDTSRRPPRTESERTVGDVAVRARPLATKPTTDSGKTSTILMIPCFDELIGADRRMLCAHITTIDRRID